MKIFEIFKRQKPKVITPTPDFSDNWRQEVFENNIKQGVASLQQGKQIKIYEDGRGYELAISIKNRFMLEYQKQLSEKIKIETTANTILVSFT